jgi:hypothetical protein
MKVQQCCSYKLVKNNKISEKYNLDITNRDCSCHIYENNAKTIEMYLLHRSKMCNFVILMPVLVRLNRTESNFHIRFSQNILPVTHYESNK